MLEAFVSKSIVYVYQKARWIFFQNYPKIIQNVPKKKYIFLLKVSPHNVLSPHKEKNNCWSPPIIRKNIQIYDWFIIYIPIIKGKND
jgi:hypothetical protein